MDLAHDSPALFGVWVSTWDDRGAMVPDVSAGQWGSIDMIDSRDRGPTKPILRCPTCSTLYGPKPNMTECSRCGGALEPAPGPKRLPDVPFATRDLPAGTYKRDVPCVLPSPNKVDL